MVKIMGSFQGRKARRPGRHDNKHKDVGDKRIVARPEGRVVMTTQPAWTSGGSSRKARRPGRHDNKATDGQQEQIVARPEGRVVMTTCWRCDSCRDAVARPEGRVVMTTLKKRWKLRNRRKARRPGRHDNMYYGKWSQASRKARRPGRHDNTFSNEDRSDNVARPEGRVVMTT